MKRLSIGVATIAVVLLAGEAGAATTTVSSSAAFATATSGSVAGDFTSVPLPNCVGSSCFGSANPLSGYASLQGVVFATPNMNGAVNVNSAFFYGASDLPVPYLVNSVYTGPAADIISITLPSAATAFGLDFSTLFASTTATFSLSNGFSTSVSPTVTTGVGGTTEFLGFLSSTPFNTITFSVPSQQSIVIADFVTAAVVPEPAAWAMLLVGFGGLGALLRHTRRRPALHAI
jgi:hypothetical protein